MTDKNSKESSFIKLDFFEPNEDETEIEKLKRLDIEVANKDKDRTAFANAKIKYEQEFLDIIFGLIEKEKLFKD